MSQWMPINVITHQVLLTTLMSNALDSARTWYPRAPKEQLQIWQSNLRTTKPMVWWTSPKQLILQRECLFMYVAGSYSRLAFMIDWVVIVTACSWLCLFLQYWAAPCTYTSGRKISTWPPKWSGHVVSHNVKANVLAMPNSSSDITEISQTATLPLWKLTPMQIS